MRFDYWSTLTCLAAVGFAAIALGSIGGCLLFEGQVLAQTSTGAAGSLEIALKHPGFANGKPRKNHGV